MAMKKGTSAVAAPLEPKVADKLLRLLSTDNDYRRLFKKDPVAALAKAGHPPARDALSARKTTAPGPDAGHLQAQFKCLSVKRIATKAEIATSREALRQHLTTAMVFSDPHCFEAGKIEICLKRR